jgi:hypothetical protein
MRNRPKQQRKLFHVTLNGNMEHPVKLLDKQRAVAIYHLGSFITKHIFLYAKSTGDPRAQASLPTVPIHSHDVERPVCWKSMVSNLRKFSLKRL